MLSIDDIRGKNLDDLPPALALQFKRIMREYLKRDGNAFDRYFFKTREGSRWLANKHHELITDTLKKVFTGEITRLIINISPGYTKTEKAVINFISQGLAINPKAKFIHGSYSDDLALVNSQTIRDQISMVEYQELYPMAVREDVSAKKRWFTEQGGGMLAVATGGSITGFRAGRMEKHQFTGALIIDDPIKPDDAYSAAKRRRVNNRFNNTIKSRLAVENIPIIVIMQRLHEDDLCGFLLTGGSGDKWHHLVLPALIEETPEPYPVNYTHGIPIEHNYTPGALWPFKHTTEQLLHLKEADPYTYASQYGQRPSPLGGGLFKAKWWKYYANEPGAYGDTYPALPRDILFKWIFGDTAQKTAEHNDFTVFQCWGFSPSQGIFLLDQVRGKWEAPELEAQLIAFWNKHKTPTVHNNFTGARGVKIEDKSSGSSLIQSVAKKTFIPVEAVQKNTDKVFEAVGCIPQIAAGNVHIPIDAPWISDYLHEFAAFTPMMTHAHDDQIDTTLMAIKDLLINRSNFYDQFGGQRK